MANRGNVLFASNMGKRPSVPSAKCPSADDADGTDGVCSKYRFGDSRPKAAVHLGPARCSAAFLKRTLAMERSI